MKAPEYLLCPDKGSVESLADLLLLPITDELLYCIVLPPALKLMDLTGLGGLGGLEGMLVAFAAGLLVAEVYWPISISEERLSDLGFGGFAGLEGLALLLGGPSLWPGRACCLCPRNRIKMKQRITRILLYM